MTYSTNICCPLCCYNPNDHNMLVVQEGDYMCPSCGVIFGMPPINIHSAEDDDD